MNCKKPYTQGVHVFGCGQCLPCRINRRRIWQARLVLESLMHEHSAFVTLTYDEENLPKDNSLNPKEFQKWIKRLRKEYSPKKLRYFGVGEYGDKSDRPHYHAILYGVEPCWKGQSMFDKEGQCCPPCDRISKTWGKGLVFIGTVTPDSAGYCSGS